MPKRRSWRICWHRTHNDMTIKKIVMLRAANLLQRDVEAFYFPPFAISSHGKITNTHRSEGARSG